MHFVVERAASLQDSFFGLVQAGKDLLELSPKAIIGAAPTLPAESQTTEVVVAALQGLHKTEPDYEEVVRKIGEYLPLLSLTAPLYLTPDFCARAVAKHHSLLGRWGQLRGGESLDFSFP